MGWRANRPLVLWWHRNRLAVAYLFILKCCCFRSINSIRGLAFLDHQPPTLLFTLQQFLALAEPVAPLIPSRLGYCSFFIRYFFECPFVIHWHDLHEVAQRVVPGVQNRVRNL